MIHRTVLQPSAGKPSDEEENDVIPVGLNDFKDSLVKKPWGYEYLVFCNEHVAVWMLQIIRKRKTSMHCHRHKKTSLVVLSGKAKFYNVNGSVDLEEFDGAVIEKGVYHSTEAFNPLPVNPQSENGIWVMEIESPPLKTDLVRKDDQYGRAGHSYEGADNIVLGPSDCFKFEHNVLDKSVSHKFLKYTFTLKNTITAKDAVSDDALVSVISTPVNRKTANPFLSIGDIFCFQDFWNHVKDEDLDGYGFLVIEKEKKVMRVADYIFSTIANLGVKKVFAVSGGGAMHLVDAVGRNPDLEYVATHHEQAAAMAAEGYARIAGHPGVALVTSGPGGTNALTGVCGAWVDSIPTIFFSGQVTCDTLLEGTGLRQFGIQESDIVELMKPVTKYAVTVKDPLTIRYHLEKAIHLATTGRPGPVWLDVPLDVQSKLINENDLSGYAPPAAAPSPSPEEKKAVQKCIALLQAAKRPVLITGHGIRLAKAELAIVKLVESLKIPVVSSWTTSDLFPTDSSLYIGRSGIMGDRASNFAVQNADLLLIIGSRMSIPQVGYRYRLFAREAKKIMVDIDPKELAKPSLSIDLPLCMDAKVFIQVLSAELEAGAVRLNIAEWLERCLEWKKKYPVVLPEYRNNKDKVNSFYFIDALSQKLGPDAIVVTDMGTSFTCTMQTFRVKKGQRLFTSSGHASMGFGLPGAIGTCLGADRRKTVCVSGDGGLQMNIQELQTVVHNKLPIILFVLNNQGYLTIKQMQQNHFGQYVGADPSSGVTTPDMLKIAQAYGIAASRISNQQELDTELGSVLAQPGPYICEIMMPENQPLIPRLSSLKKPDGTVVARPLEDLYPFLDREEFMKNMVVKPVETLK